MKKEEVVNKLLAMLQGMYYHKNLEKEILEIIIGKSGCEEDIFSDLMTQLKMLKRLGINIHKYNSNEILKKSGGIYSLHLKKGSLYNIRILIKFRDAIPYLLCTFEEKGKKRKDGAGYKKNIEIANKRFDSMDK